jgi:hypothetical protein
MPPIINEPKNYYREWARTSNSKHRKAKTAILGNQIYAASIVLELYF